MEIPTLPPVREDCDHKGYCVVLNAEINQVRKPGIAVAPQAPPVVSVVSTVMVGCSKCGCWWKPSWANPDDNAKNN